MISVFTPAMGNIVFSKATSLREGKIMNSNQLQSAKKLTFYHIMVMVEGFGYDIVQNIEKVITNNLNYEIW